MPEAAPAAAKRDRAYYQTIGALALVLTTLPYLYGWLITPHGDIYTGFTYNIDDSCVYLSWMRQAQDGHFFLRNLFTTEPQRGVLFNLLFYALGSVVRCTGLPVPIVYHAARVGGSVLALWGFTRLVAEAIPADARARRLAFTLFCFAAGVGWLWGGYSPTHGIQQPVDLWQPEAISFLSLYFSPLFACALAGIVVFQASALRVERTGRLRDAIPAMVAGALLGNFHSYDVIPLFAGWFVLRILRDITARRLNLNHWIPLALVGVAAAPTTLYMYWATRVEPVFYQRALVTSTLSPRVWWDFLGFGLPVVYAAVAIWRGLRFSNRSIDPATQRARELISLTPLPDSRSGSSGERETREYPSGSASSGNGKSMEERVSESGGGERRSPDYLFLLTYFIVYIAVAYVPVAFQRKLLMGAQVPLCVLGGMGLAALSARLPGDFPKITALFGVLLTVPSNALFLLRDVDRLGQNASSTSYQPYLKPTEVAALDYLRDKTPPASVVLVSPDADAQNRPPNNPLMPYLAVYVPAMTGRTAYIGHWGETADYARLKMGQMRQFFHADGPDPARSDAYRRQILRDGHVGYVLYDNRLANGAISDSAGKPLLDEYRNPLWVGVDWLKNPPPYLTVAFSNADITIFAVDNP